MITVALGFSHTMVLKPTGYQTGTVIHLNVLHTGLFLLSEKCLGATLVGRAVFHHVYSVISSVFAIAAPTIDVTELLI